MEIDAVSGVLRHHNNNAHQLTSLFRWHSSDGKGRRGISAVISSFYLFQKAQELMKGQRVTPYVSMALSLLCWALFFVPEFVLPMLPWLTESGVGLVPVVVLQNGFLVEWKRLAFAALPHDSNWHVFYCLMSFMYRGSRIESRFGSVYLSALLTSLQLVSSLLHVWVSSANGWDLHKNAYGLNALLMALKVILNADPNQRETLHYFGFTLHGHWIAWLEIGLLYLLFPHRQATHAQGILRALFSQLHLLQVWLTVVLGLSCTVALLSLHRVSYRRRDRWRAVCLRRESLPRGAGSQPSRSCCPARSELPAVPGAECCGDAAATAATAHCPIGVQRSRRARARRSCTVTACACFTA